MTGLFSRDAQVRAMEQRVSQAEKLLGRLCLVLAGFTRKTARLRDKGDELVGQLYELSRSEDPELQLGLKSLAEDLALVQDYRQAQVDRLDIRVVAPLKAYGDVIKTKRAELKRFSVDQSREMKEIQKLEKLRLKNPADRQSIAEVSAQKASNNAQRNVRLMEETIMDFEKNRLQDIKRIFSDFVSVEMLFHAKVLEIYTHTFHNLEAMDLQRDLEVFSGRVQMSDVMSSRLDSPVSGHHSPLQSPSSRGTLRERQGPNTNPWPRPGRTLRRQRHMEQQPQGEEDQEDDEEESDTEAPPTRRSYVPQSAQGRRRIH